MTRILLVRHGETDWNRIGLYQGTTDVPLNARGLRQATALAAALHAEPIAAIYTSPLERAHSTALAIAGRCNSDLEVIPELREISYGLWQGKSIDWSRRQHPILEHRWRTAPWTVRFPGGETLLVDLGEPLCELGCGRGESPGRRSDERARSKDIADRRDKSARNWIRREPELFHRDGAEERFRSFIVEHAGCRPEPVIQSYDQLGQVSGHLAAVGEEKTHLL